MVSPFETMGLRPELVQAVEQLGYEQATPIQLEAIPALLAGRNVIGQAQTGTGKTAAFALPMLQRIQPGAGYIQALVLAPTRELAIQVAEATTRMAVKTPVRVIPVYGGQSYEIQLRKIKRGVEVVVGTPGRLLDLIRQNVLNLSKISYLVLDEADEMLEMGFIDDVEAILAQVTGERQVALFSATMPAAIRSLAERYVTDPHVIRIDPTRLTVAETDQRYCRVREEDKLEAMCRFIEVDEVRSALIFARTKARAQELADSLIERGYPAESLHGDLSQARRETVLHRFRQRSVTMLVATDVAARGLDIEDVSHVFNFDVPNDAEDYVHRIGRTGRAGRKGVAITFFHPKDRVRRVQIQAYTRQPMEEIQIPTREQIQAQRDNRFITRMYELMLLKPDETTASEQNIVMTMVEAGVDLADLAAAAIRLARQNESKLPLGDLNIPAEMHPPRSRKPLTNEVSDRSSGKPAGDYRSEKTSRPRRELPQSDRSNGQADRAPRQAWQRENPGPSGKQRVEESGMVRLRMNLGDRQGLRPSDVVGAIAGEVGIPGKAIGEINIFRNHTFVDISEKHVSRVLQQSDGQYQLFGRPVTLTLVS